MSKHVWHKGQAGERIGITAPILDAHGRPLAEARTVAADDPKAVLVIQSGRPFLIDHTNFDAGHNWISDYLRAHPDFQTLSTEALPPNAVMPSRPENTNAKVG